MTQEAVKALKRRTTPVSRIFRNYSLSLVLAALFLTAWLSQALSPAGSSSVRNKSSMVRQPWSLGSMVTSGISIRRFVSMARAQRQSGITRFERSDGAQN